MRRLLLLRHAKSSWNDETLDDHLRPLDERGERAAAIIGAYLAQSRIRVDRVLCSTALRATQTVERVGRLVELPEPTLEPSLYLATGQALLERLRRLPEAAEGVLLVGHNPGIADLAENIAGRGATDDLDRMVRKFPTAGLAVLHIGPAGWSGLRPGSASLEHFVTPKRLV
ncbi:MAG: SixA phosphatase family protein [Myxococcota bacterium]